MKKLIISLGALIPVMAYAHNGHGAFQGTGLHYLLSVAHLVPLTLMVASVWLVIREILRTLRRDPLNDKL